MNKTIALRPVTVAMLALMLAACGGGDGDDSTTAVVPEPARPQDSRTFTKADPTATTFPAMAADASDTVAMSTTSRYAGVLDGASYRIEVPATWNGKLVMYAHGYAGNDTPLGVSNPSIRRHLIQQGYAWAASSYTKNYYDVRAGVEDTNKLALNFNAITTAAGRTGLATASGAQSRQRTAAKLPHHLQQEQRHRDHQHRHDKHCEGSVGPR